MKSLWAVPAVTIIAWSALLADRSPAASPASAPRNETVTLAHDGRPMVKLVVASAGAIPAEQTAAEELAAYLQRITGAAFEVVPEDASPAEAPAVYVGHTRFARAAGIDPAALGPEEAVLRTQGKSLILTGGRPRGTLYAVYDLLENGLGVRWYTAWAEKVPQSRTVTVPAMDRRLRPYFMYRDAYTLLTDPRMYADHAGWLRFLARNRATIMPDGSALAEALGAQKTFGGRVSGGHGFAPYLPADKYFKDHPEYYSMRDGKRVPSNGLDGHHACLSNPDVLRIILEGVREDIRKDPSALCYTVAVNDGGCKTICDCPACRRIAEQYGATRQSNTDTGLLAWFVNQVADAVAHEHPDKYIRTLIYGPACSVPRGIRFRDNVIVQLCTGPSADWVSVAKHLWIWQYTDEVRRGNYVRPLLWRVDDEIKLAHRLGVVSGMFQENEFVFGNDCLSYQFYEMFLWVFYHLCQDPTRDVEALVNDFLAGFYGPAAPALRTWLDLLKTRRALYPFRVFDYETARRAQECFDQAEAACARDPETLARVRDLRIPLDITLMSLRNTIMQDYLRTAGRSPETYPFSRALLKSRVLAALEASRHPFLHTTAPIYRHDDKGNTRVTFEPLLPRIIQLVEELCAGKEFVPLPEPFRSLPPDRVFDLTAGGFGLSPYCETATARDLMKLDPQAADGTAYVRLSAEELPLPIGVWNQTVEDDPALAESQREFLKLDQSGRYVDWPHVCRTIKREDIPGPGYHLYRGPRFRLRPATLLYATKSWQFGQQLGPFFRADRPREQWDVYLSAKFTGPAYPHGQADEPNAVYIDRVILVRMEEPAAP